MLQTVVCNISSLTCRDTYCHQTSDESVKRGSVFHPNSASAKFRSTPPPNWVELKQMPQDMGQLQSELQKTRNQLYDLQSLTRDSQVAASDLIQLQREKNSFIMELATTRGKLRVWHGHRCMFLLYILLYK